VPRWETVPREQIEASEHSLRGQTTQIRAQKPAQKPSVSDERETIEGTFSGLDDERRRGNEYARVLLVQTQSGERRIELSKVEELRFSNGSYWGEGMAAGAVIDVIVVILVLTHPIQPSFSSGSSGRF
jgi:hypothetical protein